MAVNHWNKDALYRKIERLNHSKEGFLSPILYCIFFNKFKNFTKFFFSAALYLNYHVICSIIKQPLTTNNAKKLTKAIFIHLLLKFSLKVMDLAVFTI